MCFNIYTKQTYAFAAAAKKYIALLEIEWQADGF
jgi:hypothetical protein